MIHSCSYFCDRPECIKAQRDELRERLAQPEQEPFATVSSFNDLGGTYDLVSPPNYRPPVGALIYTNPQPAQQPLTERELMKCITQAKCFGTVNMTCESGPYEIDRPTLKAFEFARTIEAAHGITGEKK